MNNLTSILWLAFWPVLIYAIYRITLLVMKRKGYLWDDQDDHNQ